jgi:hypothetical protein
VIELVLVAGGFVVGFVIGRWWAVAAAVGFGIWVALAEEVEIDGWWLGLAYGVLAGIGIIAGVAVRRHRARRT